MRHGRNSYELGVVSRHALAIFPDQPNALGTRYTLKMYETKDRNS
jgi:hypothetical protein